MVQSTQFKIFPFYLGLPRRHFVEQVPKYVGKMHPFVQSTVDWKIHRIYKHAWDIGAFEIKSCETPYILESNPHPFYSFRGLKNQVRIRIACGLDSRSWAGFWKNDRAAVCAVRTIQYNNLLFIILHNILYNIYNLLFIRLAVITHNWISLPCRQGAVEGKVQIRTAN